MTRMPKPMVQADVCGTCIHYHQHYVLMPKGGWMPVWYGHCGKPRMKGHSPDETCEFWEDALREE